MANRSGDSEADLIRRYIAEVEAHPRLSVDEERALGELIDEDATAAQEARRKLIQSNLRVVVAVARRYEGRGVNFLDLVQEGNLGLMRAVDRYEPSDGIEFAATATWFIRQAISRVLADATKVLPPPFDPGFAPPPSARRSSLLSSVPTAIRPPSDDTGPFDQAAEALEREALELQLEWLSPREQMVLRLRFGLDETGQLSYARVAEEFDVTKEHLRQIEKKAMSKLRHPSVARLWSADQRKATGS
jgi:RNA polymerase primary sigma factor